MPWCPKCKAEFREGFTECSTCQVPLVDSLPEENEVSEREKFVLQSERAVRNGRFASKKSENA